MTVLGLGINWTPGSKFNFPRNHIKTSCEDFQPLFHLGGRFFLSTMSQKLKLSTKSISTTPLTVYHIPCNETSSKKKNQQQREIILGILLSTPSPLVLTRRSSNLRREDCYAIEFGMITLLIFVIIININKHIYGFNKGKFKNH